MIANVISKHKSRIIDGVFRSNILSKFGRSSRGFYWNLVDLENEATGQKTFFRDDYTSEVRKVSTAIHDYNVSFGAFIGFLNGHLDLGKQMLQHIYTFDQNAFEKLKESITFQRINQSQRHDERDLIFVKFTAMLGVKYSSMQYETRPEFGACKDCWKYLDRKQKKQYKKLNDVKDDFWDWTKW